MDEFEQTRIVSVYAGEQNPFSLFQIIFNSKLNETVAFVQIIRLNSLFYWN